MIAVQTPTAPVPLTYEQVQIAARNMEIHGGGFAGRIGGAWFYADSTNRRRLEAAFEDLFRRYAKW